MRRDDHAENADPDIVGKADTLASLAEQEKHQLHEQQQRAHPQAELTSWQALVQGAVGGHHRQQHQGDDRVGVTLGLRAGLAQQQRLAQRLEHVVGKHHQEAVQHEIQYGPALAGSQPGEQAGPTFPAVADQHLC